MKQFTFPIEATIFVVACLAGAAFAADAPPVERGSAEEKNAAVNWGFTPDPTLPDVLILGDSISIGYTPIVRANLKGVANVFRPMSADGKLPANCSDTGKGLKSLDTWLANRKWRVIHFNFGLHDLKYLDEKGKYVTPDKGKQVTLPDQYEKNLRELVTRLKKTDATLIWCATTPVPAASAGRVENDHLPYNAIAKKVMDENAIQIDDLCAALGNRLSQLQRPKNVHFTDEGSKVLADAVTAAIKQALSKPSTPAPQKTH